MTESPSREEIEWLQGQLNELPRCFERERNYWCIHETALLSLIEAALIRRLSAVMGGEAECEICGPNAGCSCWGSAEDTTLAAMPDRYLAGFEDGREMAATELKRRIGIEGSQKNAAAVLGISPAYLSDILLGRREISATVAAALGFERLVVFRALQSKDAGE